MSSSEETTEQLQARLSDLTTRAAAKDAVKDYNAAAELYSQATEIQAQLNGEMSLENVGLLYAYGKSLYNVAVSKSDVLGSKVAGESTQPQAMPKPSSSSAVESMKPGIIQTAVSGASPGSSGPVEQKKPPSHLFQFTGDENFEDSDSDEENGAENPEEEDDDFENAFEVLDLARILSLKKLEEIENSSVGKAKDAGIDPATKQIKERLADIYDLQAEISLEGERFENAVSDLRAALELKEALLPFEDPSIAECHYKLSLALEFASVTQPEDEDEQLQENKKPATVDEAMRNEAAKHMETAIESCKIRMAQEERKLTDGEIKEEDKVNAAKRKIANVKEIVADMEQRLLELRRPPVSINDPSQDAGTRDALNGILGQIIGKSSEEQKAALEHVTKSANDLSALVRKKAPSSSSKRQHENNEEAETSKRAKTEDPA